MALTIVGRLNIGGAPTAPVMSSEGVMTYRPTLGTVRQADFAAATDVALGTILHGLVGTAYSATIVGNNYMGVVDTSFIAPGAAAFMTANDLTTGAYLVQQLPPGTTIRRVWGVTRVSPFGAACMCYTDQGGNRAAFWTPPGVVTVYTVQQNQRLWGNLVFGITNTIVQGLQLIGVKMDGVPNSNIAYAPNLTIDNLIGGIALLGIFQSAGFPWFMEQDAGVPNKMYYLRYQGAPPNNEYLVEHDTTTNIKTNHNLGPVSFALTPNCYDAFKITPAFDRFHFTSWSPTQRVYGGPLLTPVLKAAMDFVDVDSAVGPTPSITALWVYPPHIYVSKTAGTGFGNQLIKIHDDAMEVPGAPGGARHSGGELWSLIPEMKDYLG